MTDEPKRATEAPAPLRSEGVIRAAEDRHPMTPPLNPGGWGLANLQGAPRHRPQTVIRPPDQ